MVKGWRHRLERLTWPKAPATPASYHGPILLPQPPNTRPIFRNDQNWSKVETAISVKISKCSYLERSFSLTKNTEKVKWKRCTKTIFSKFSCKELNIFCNFKVKYFRSLFPLCRPT
jgi:hypothetical protein